MLGPQLVLGDRVDRHGQLVPGAYDPEAVLADRLQMGTARGRGHPLSGPGQIARQTAAGASETDHTIGEVLHRPSSSQVQSVMTGPLGS